MLKSLTEFSTFLAILPDLCFVVDEAGTIIDANPLACNALGLSHPVKTFPTIHRHFTDETVFRTIIREPDSSDGGAEVRIKTAHGAWLDTIALARRIPLDDTEPECFLLILRDITEQKRKELDLLRFSEVVHYSVNPLEITDIDGKLIYVNPAFAKASGYSVEELIGKNPSIFGSGKYPREFWKAMWDMISSGKVWVGDVENKRRDGEPFYTQLLISPIVNAQKMIVGYLGVHRDLTRQRQLEHQLIHAQKMESIGTLAAGLAHEVGNPLTSISSLVQVIQRTTEDSFAKEKLELVKTQINRISRIIRDLVDFSRPSNYEMRLTDINTSVREAIDITRAGKKAKDVVFHVVLEERLPLVPLIHDQIEQVFINILLNSLDALQEYARGPERKRLPEVTVRTAKDETGIHVAIADNGPGITAEHLSRIFEPFFTTKSVGQGTGLGLWVSYGIVRSFRGDITVESMPGLGTTFTVTLPLQAGDPGSIDG